MNPSKKDIMRGFAAVLLFLTIFFCFIQRFVPMPTGEGMSHDAKYIYAESIETEILTDWFSSLFIYESIILKRCLQYFIGSSVSGVYVLYVVFWLFTCLMGAAIALLVQRLIRENWMWILFVPVLAVLAYQGMFTITIGLDYYFIGFLWCELIVILLHYHTKSKWRKITYTCLILVILFHLVSYRKNAILYIPIVTGYLIYTSACVSHFRTLQKLVLWGGLTVMFSFLSMKLVDSILPVQKQYPVSPMMESDVRIASILRGEEPVYWMRNMVPQMGRSASAGVMSAYWLGRSREVEWNDFRDVYIEEWKNNYDTMLVAGIIQRVHFFFGDYGISWIRGVIENRYPAVKGNERAWKKIFIVRGPRFILSRVVLVLTPLAIWLAYILCRRKWIPPFASSFVVVAGTLSVVYASSFIIVTPTPDYRYLTPSVMLAVLAMFVLAATVGMEMIKRIISRMGTQSGDNGF